MNIDKALTITGWMSEDELRFLAEQARRAKTIVEFGCYMGRSTRALADNTEGVVYAVDPWNGIYLANDGSIHGIRTDVYNQFEQNLKDKIETSVVIPVPTFSSKFNTSHTADFVFIDGDHRYLTVKEDIKIGLELLKEGGILAGHDYSHGDWPGVKQAVDEAFPEINLTGSIWWVYVKSSDWDSNIRVSKSS